MRPDYCFVSEAWKQTIYCWKLTYKFSHDPGREHQDMIQIFSPPDEIVKPEYRRKTECRVCKEHLVQCEGGYSAAHWHLFNTLHTYLKPGVVPVNPTYTTFWGAVNKGKSAREQHKWDYMRALREWESTYLIKEGAQ